MRVFLDMDGLLADLFNRVSKKTHNKPYKALTFKEKEEAKRIWTNKKEATCFFKTFDGVENFFATLPDFGNKTRAVINASIAFAGEYTICTCPAAIDKEASIKGKIKWIYKNLHPAPTEMLFPVNKSTYALNKDGTPNILIDDFPPYIQSWRNAGGIAIEMQTDAFENAVEVDAFLKTTFNHL